MLAIKNLSRNKLRTLLNIIGVTLAIISLVILTSLGSGLLDTGEQVLKDSSMHLWMKGRPVDLKTQYIQSSEARISDVHQIRTQIQADPRVNMSTPLLTEIVYAYKEGEDPKAVFGLGVDTGGPIVTISSGAPISTSTLYNGSTYDGPFTSEVLVDSRAAHLLGVEVGDTIFAGKTISDARNRQFKVVGISDSLSTFSINAMVIFPFPEFQLITGNHNHDSASMIIVRLNDVNTAEQVKNDLQKRYPEYQVSTNRELLNNIIKQNGFFIVSASSIVILAIVMGTSLIILTMLLSLNERKKEIGILQVVGFSRLSIARNFGFEGFIISIIGGISGILLSVPVAGIINQIVKKMTGLDELLVLDNEIMLLGFSMAVIIGLLSTLATIWRLSTIEPMEQIRSV
jgi:putative ABC transport system permease protein